MTRTARLLPVIALLVLAGCARQVASAIEPDAPGFLLGVWHGFIFPFAWFVSLFTDVSIYAVPNNGGWYDFGYFIGIMFLGVGAHRGKRVVYRERIVETRGPIIDQ
ncbi:hypothetical protein [Novosphingobium malaysiense]|uniref:Lipoprotein n=1 Tax=Novosphingobium malaysiense TaxID=1348853 RepID=A0A0B1ZJT1_9SPHN|nr:hypothetical protein [Novosphingobium malaysiense]KHK89436.1 hypothetical protein LK12_20125 [Novosphingobium malaysiense]